FLAAVTAVQAAGMQAYADVVFNHKDGADHVERVRAQIVDWDDRNHALSDWHEIGAWTNFTFPGRGAVHSSMQWHADHFDALSYNADTNNGSRPHPIEDKPCAKRGGPRA